MDFRKILISQIAATSIDYSYRIKYDEYKKFHLRREYFIVFLTRNGRKIKISNWYREYTECLQIAMEIAEKLNIEFRQNSKAGVM